MMLTKEKQVPEKNMKILYHMGLSEVYFLEGALLSLGSCRGRQEELWSHTQKGTFQGLSNED